LRHNQLDPLPCCDRVSLEWRRCEMTRLPVGAVGLALLLGIILSGMVGSPFGSPPEASAAKKAKRAAPTATAVGSRTPTPATTAAPAATPTSTPTPAPAGTVTPAGPRMEKDANVLQPGVQTTSNLWLMAGGCQDATQRAKGKGCLVVDMTLTAAFDSDSCNDDDDGDTLPCGDPSDPNLQGQPVDPSGELPEGVGTWEEQIVYDERIVSLEVDPDNAWLQSGGRIASCSYYGHGILCVTEDDPNLGGIQLGPNGDSKIAQVVVYPRLDDLKLRIRPTNNNGVATSVIDQNCEVADIFGQPLPGTEPGGLTKVCTDVRITVRILEGDLNLDCVVDASDYQAIAYRYGSTSGTLLYRQWYDLEPQFADGDIDIKDLQFVFGRYGSTCENPMPNQLPLPPPGT
jgi:hypothetical protein